MANKDVDISTLLCYKTCNIKPTDDGSCIECDLCLGWLHKTCATAVDPALAKTLEERKSKRSSLPIPFWMCPDCRELWKTLRNDNLVSKYNTLMKDYTNLKELVEQLLEKSSSDITAHKNSPATEDAAVVSRNSSDVSCILKDDSFSTTLNPGSKDDDDVSLLNLSSSTVMEKISKVTQEHSSNDLVTCVQQLCSSINKLLEQNHQPFNHEKMPNKNNGNSRNKKKNRQNHVNNKPKNNAPGSLGKNNANLKSNKKIDDIPKVNTINKGLHINPELGKTVLVLGDSLLKNSWRTCSGKDILVRCYPGLNFNKIKSILLNTNINRDIKFLNLFMGTNNLKQYKSNNDDYLTEFKNVILSCKTIFPNAKINVNGILRRRDYDIKFITSLNNELQKLCVSMNILFSNPNKYISNDELCIDGLHLSKSGCKILGYYLKKTIQDQSESVHKNNNYTHVNAGKNPDKLASGSKHVTGNRPDSNSFTGNTYDSEKNWPLLPTRKNV